MIDSIYIGMSGLTGFSDGLRVIANNTTNLNTPGFKGSSLQFSDLFAASGGFAGGAPVGHGVGTSGTLLNFAQGSTRQTGGDLDLAINGDGLFTIKDSLGKIHYTRDGRFKFDDSGTLVTVADGSKVMGLAADGSLQEISIASLRTKVGQATGTVKFSGNLPSDATTAQTIPVTVFDSLGGSHALSLVFTKATGTGGTGGTGGTAGQTWNVQLNDGSNPVGIAQQMTFTGSSVSPASQLLTFTFTPTGAPPTALTFDFTTGVTSLPGTAGLPAMTSTPDGFGPGAATKETFDASGTLTITYANGQTATGPQLALARFDSLDAVSSVGNGNFDAIDAGVWHTGVASSGAFGSIAAGQVEISNVDLSQEFSDLVIMQRGFQASSQIVSTASDMLQQLLTMKGQ
jgi:flagellar hook protein FlgE